jgi:hypothetical protein
MLTQQELLLAPTMREDTAVVCVRSRFFSASAFFHEYPYPTDPYPPSWWTFCMDKGKDNIDLEADAL